MISVLVSLVLSVRSGLRSRAELQLELIALWHQLQVLNRSRPRRLPLATADRCLWVWLSRSWPAWRTALVIVKPETVIAWHRQGFRLFWTWKSLVGSGTGAAIRRRLLGRVRGSPLGPRVGVAVTPFPVPAASHAACGVTALRAPASFVAKAYEAASPWSDCIARSVRNPVITE